MTDDTTGGWVPDRPVEVVAGTPPGGGLDRSAHALVDALRAGGLLEVDVDVVNVPGDGARLAWSYIDERRGDACVLSISHPNLTTDHLVGLTAFNHSSFTPIAKLYTEYLAFVVHADDAVDAHGLLARLADDAAGVSVALSTALGNPNHIAFAQVTRHAGGQVTAPTVRAFDSALDAVAAVGEGDADVGVVTAASILPALDRGAVRCVAVSSPERLRGPFASVPTWLECSVPCEMGAWRGVSAPAGLDPAAVSGWQRILRAATTSVGWQQALDRHHWTASYLDGSQFDDDLAAERDDMAAILEELGLRTQ